MVVAEEYRRNSLWDGAIMRLAENIIIVPERVLNKARAILASSTHSKDHRDAGYILGDKGSMQVSNPAYQSFQERRTKMFGFGEALEQLKCGNRVQREGWNGKGMWLALQEPDANSKMTLPYIYIEYPVGHPAYPNGSRVPWLASQTDMLSEDWSVVF